MYHGTSLRVYAWLSVDLEKIIQVVHLSGETQQTYT